MRKWHREEKDKWGYQIRVPWIVLWSQSCRGSGGHENHTSEVSYVLTAWYLYVVTKVSPSKCLSSCVQTKPSPAAWRQPPPGSHLCLLWDEGLSRGVGGAVVLPAVSSLHSCQRFLLRTLVQEGEMIDSVCAKCRRWGDILSVENLQIKNWLKVTMHQQFWMLLLTKCLQPPLSSSCRCSLGVAPAWLTYLGAQVYRILIPAILKK